MVYNKSWISCASNSTDKCFDLLWWRHTWTTLMTSSLTSFDSFEWDEQTTTHLISWMTTSSAGHSKVKNVRKLINISYAKCRVLAFNAGICQILYKTRLGSFNIETEVDHDMAVFIGSVHNIFTSAFIGTFPPFLTKTVFRKYHKMNDNAWAKVFEIGERNTRTCTCILIILAVHYRV